MCVYILAYKATGVVYRYKNTAFDSVYNRYWHWTANRC